MSRHLELHDNKLYEYEFARKSFFLGGLEERRITDPERMIFSQKGNRAYYKIGDHIFTRKWTPEDAGKHYEEFAGRLNAEYSWGTLIMYLLDISDITITKEIVEINGSQNGFSVVFKSYMVVSEKERLQLHYIGGRDHEVVSDRQLNNTYVWTGLIHDTAGIEPAAMVMLEIITLPIGGAAKQVATRALAPLMRRYGRRILTKLFTDAGKQTFIKIASKEIAKTTAKLFAEFAADVATGIIKQYYAEIKKNQLRGAAGEDLIRSIDLDVIIARAFRDAVAKFITGAISEAFGSLVPQTAVDGLFDKQLKERTTDYMNKFMLNELLAPFNLIIKAAIVSIDFPDDETTYSQRLGKKIEKDLLKKYSPKGFADIAAKPLKNILSSPQLIL